MTLRSDSIGYSGDLSGRVAVVTGATSGLGYATALGLLRRGATVYIAARDEKKALASISRLQAEGLGPGLGKPIWHKLDLDNPQEAKKSAEAFLARNSRLDILINNAACLGKNYALGPIGVQDIVATNYISPFLFTKTLLPLMKKTTGMLNADVRIVNITSDTHRLISEAQFHDKEHLNGPTKSNGTWQRTARYRFTKFLVILWTKELARRLTASVRDGGADILCIAVDPGPLASETILASITKFPWPISLLIYWLIRLVCRTPAEAAVTPLAAVTDPDIRKARERYHGGYLVPVVKLAESSKLAADEGLAKDLWSLTVRILTEGKS